MPAESQKKEMAKFPLRLVPYLRRTAEDFSRKEGVSLNQFINLAVAEKLAHLEHKEHERWMRSRKQVTKEDIAEAIRLLDKVALQQTEPGDELPEGYVPLRERRHR